jgi:serine/threonine protein kinase
VYSVGALSNGSPYIEMQFVDGTNLAQLLRASGRLAPDVARRLLAQLAGALATAHENGVIHRDVAPANVLIGADSQRAYLTDFGVAGMLETGSEAVTRLTRQGDRLGDPTYMSPEQLRGEVLTPQADIYGIGLIGYEMLTLEGPFANADIKDVAAAHIRREPLDLCALSAAVPADLGDLLRRCLAKKPEHRPTAALLAARLTGADTAAVETPGEDGGVLGSFLKELRQRKVYRAAMAYAAAVFLVLQVADLLLPTFTSSDLPYRVLVVISLAFFPMLVALAWIYDLRQGRLTRTGDEELSGRRLSGLPRLLMQVSGLVLSAALSGAMAWWLLVR